MQTMRRLYRVAMSILLMCFFIACDNDGAGRTDGGSDAYAEARQACVDRINQYRKTAQLPPYERWSEGEGCADAQAKKDAASNTAHSAFGQCDEFAQNECPAWNSVDQVLEGCLQMMWDEGPGEDFNVHGHYINMSSTRYTQVACGYYTTSDGSIWAVQNFR